MPLISRINQKSLRIVNNETFNVTKINKSTITLKNEMKELEFPIEKISRNFNLAFCITIHKSQGSTFNNSYSIYEWYHLNSTLKYVALSRATDINNISIM